MADGGKSTLQSILENLRDAAVGFGERFAPPRDVPAEIRRLLEELGIDDPANVVSAGLAAAAANWAAIANQLKGINFNFLNPAAAVAGLVNIGNTIRQRLDDMVRLPGAVVAQLGANGAAIAAALPERLLAYIVFEFVTRSHKKIGGAFLLLGVLRREPKPKIGAVPAVNVPVRVFDVGQLIRVLTNPRAAILDALRWGRDDFDSETVVDGVSLLLGLLAGAGVVLGPDEDTFPPASEAPFVGRTAAELAALPVASARRTATVGPATLAVVGLHRDGLGLLVPNPINLSGGVGALKLPALPPGQILAISAGSPPATGDPRVRRLP